MSYHIESNYKEALAEVRESLTNLVDEKIMRTAGLTTVAIILNRVQQKGQNADGRKRQSKSKKTSGAYSKGYASQRRKKGRQTEFVDLTNSGDMLRAFNVVAADQNSADVGFISEQAAQIAEYNEAYYGKIFELSQSEEKKVVDGAVAEILNKLK